MRKILITGGSGFIGSNLVRLLVKEKGCTALNLDKLTYAGTAGALSDLEGRPDYYFEHVDLGDASALDSIFDRYQPDAVMHLAAESHVDRSIDGPDEFIQTNIVGTYNLLQSSLAYWRSRPEADGALGLSSPTKQSFRFLHVSTDEVFGSLAPEAPAFTERSPYDPHSPYSASKAASDHLVRAWGDTYGLPVIVTHCSNNYGPYQFPEKLIPLVILKCLRGESIPVYGKGENIRDWLYVEDHVEALYSVLTKGRVGETYNIGANNERTNLELVNMLCKLMDEFAPLATPHSSPSTPILHERLITFVQDRPGHDLRYAIDSTKIRDELGWKPSKDFDSGLRKTVQWYLENDEWWGRIFGAGYRFERL